MRVTYTCDRCGNVARETWASKGAPPYRSCPICKGHQLEPRYLGEPDRTLGPWISSRPSKPPRTRRPTC